MASPIPENEAERLKALRDLGILDTPPEPIYDDIVKIAAAICGTPIAAINFIDADRQWDKASVGGDSFEAPREVSFCARTILAENDMFVVPDTHADPEWVDNELVTGPAALRFYAGAAIRDQHGYGVGSLCVADTDPSELSEQQREALSLLARQASEHLRVRAQSRELRAANDKLRQMVVVDPLTGLANRTLLHDRLTQAVTNRRRSDMTVGVLFADLDDFKAINDRLGHDAGDTVLRAVAERMVGAARLSDTVARLSGDEFVILCPGLASADDIEAVATRMTRAVETPVMIADEHELTPRLSVGSAIVQDGDQPETVLRRADEAMYNAKRLSSGA
jgi:diguanylate cyclase (GGDEF)-like protein